jgi:CheY-like chemotaxis protein
VRCCEQTVGLPLLSIEASIAARAAELRLGPGPARVVHRDELLPLVDLAARLRLRAPEPPSEGQPLLVVSALGRRVALAVDRVEGDLELLVRPLPAEVRELPSYQGAAMLARGELALILRPDWVVGADGGWTPGPGQARRALVIDDSLTARAHHRAMLEAGGFQVHAVASGRQGLERLARSAYDVIVCDVAMDEMDGLAFTAAARALPNGREVPVVLVTAHEAELGGDAWRAAGADRCLSKRECAAGRLLAEVNALIARRPVSA